MPRRRTKTSQQSEIKPKQSRPYVTLEYPYTDEMVAILMIDAKQTYYYMEKDNRIIYPKSIRFSKIFRDVFSKAGYNFIPEQKSHPLGKKRIFGIPVTIRRIDQGDKKIIRVKIEGLTVEDVNEKVRKIEKEIRNITNEEPEMKLWERLEIC